MNNYLAPDRVTLASIAAFFPTRGMDHCFAVFVVTDFTISRTFSTAKHTIHHFKDPVLVLNKILY